MRVCASAKSIFDSIGPAPVENQPKVVFCSETFALNV